MPFIPNIMMYIYAALAVAAIAFFMRYDYLGDRVKKQTIEIAQIKVALTAATETLKVERESLRLANENRTKYILELEMAENELKTLRARVTAGTAKLRISATCAKTTATDTAGSTEAAPRLTEDAEQAYWDIRKEITQCPAQLALAIKTLQDDRKWQH